MKIHIIVEGLAPTAYCGRCTNSGDGTTVPAYGTCRTCIKNYRAWHGKIPPVGLVGDRNHGKTAHSESLKHD